HPETRGARHRHVVEVGAPVSDPTDTPEGLVPGVDHGRTGSGLGLGLAGHRATHRGPRPGTSTRTTVPAVSMSWRTRRTFAFDQPRSRASVRSTGKLCWAAAACLVSSAWRAAWSPAGRVSVIKPSWGSW